MGRIIRVSSALFLMMIAPDQSFAALTGSCEVIGIQGSAFVSTDATGVKRSIRIGETLRPGQMLEFRSGNHVRLKLDEAEENVVVIEGPARIEIQHSGRYGMDWGRMHALLDNLSESDGFSVETPDVVAAVRGTYFSVYVSPILTEALVYKGTVDLSFKPASGVLPAHKTLRAFEGVATVPHAQGELKDVALDAARIRKIERVISYFDKTRTIPYLNSPSVAADGTDASSGAVLVDSEDNTQTERQGKSAVDHGKVLF